MIEGEYRIYALLNNGEKLLIDDTFFHYFANKFIPAFYFNFIPYYTYSNNNNKVMIVRGKFSYEINTEEVTFDDDGKMIDKNYKFLPSLNDINLKLGQSQLYNTDDSRITKYVGNGVWVFFGKVPALY